MDDEKKTCCCGCSQRKKERTPEEYKRLIHRLNRIEGQIRGIRGMVENDAYCPDILVQSGCRASAHPNGRFFQHIIPFCGHQYPPAGRKAPPQEKTCGGVFYVLQRSSRYSSPPSVITA